MPREHQFEAHHGPYSPQCGDTTIKEQTMSDELRLPPSHEPPRHICDNCGAQGATLAPHTGKVLCDVCFLAPMIAAEEARQGGSSRG